MYNNLLLTLCISIIPMLGIGFVVLLVLYKVYIKVRSQFNIKVNCWFCNVDTKVPYLEANSWTCPSCQQYNGFNKNGDYNKEIFEQLHCSQTPKRFCATGLTDNFADCSVQRANGFCDNCNEAQRLKIEKFAKFEPKNEKRFEEEFSIYKNRLESEFSLCSTCDRHLYKVLREKKKMVLGSKFLNLIIKGAETLIQPHLNQLQQLRQNQWKRRCRIWILLLTLIQLLCLCNSLPAISKDQITFVVGENFGNITFSIVTHVLALMRVTSFYLKALSEHKVISKLMLFIRTIYMMLIYSMGLRNAHLNPSSLFINTYPFAVLILSFIHNIVDGFHLSRYTILMALWSCFSAGLLDQIGDISSKILLFIATISTFICTFIDQTEKLSKLADTANSFHKMYSDDYLSDEDTISMLSKQFNGSIISNGSACSNRSFGVNSPFPSLHTISPSHTFSEGFKESPARFGSYMTDLKSSTGNHRNPYSPHCNLRRRNCSSVNDAFRMNNTSSPMQTAAEPISFSYNNKPEADFYNQPLNSGKYRSTSLYKPYAGMEESRRISSVNNTVCGAVRPNSRNIISPSRFNLPNSNCYSASWLSGGYFNRPPQALFANDFRNKDSCIQEDNLSRASSQSSGFESQQQTPLNTSRENSYGPPDANDDIHQRTLKADNVNAFVPIKSAVCSNLHNSNTSHPPSNTFNSNWTTSNICQKPLSSSNHKNDSFNLRKIDEQLPILDAKQLNNVFQETRVES